MTMRPVLETLAAALAAAWREGGTVPLPPEADAPATRAEAYAVQDRMATLIGGRVAGWKVGATVKAVQMFEGHDGPLPGRVFADRVFTSPARLPGALLRGLKCECEFAFATTAPLPDRGGVFHAEDIAPFLVFHPAVELAATRYAPGTGGRGTTTYDGIADNGTAGAVLLGPAVRDWKGLAFETMPIDARIDGSPPIQAYGGPYRRDPVVIMAETATDLLARGVRLEPGQFVLTGSATLPTPLRRGQRLVTRFGDLPAFEAVVD